MDNVITELQAKSRDIVRLHDAVWTALVAMGHAGANADTSHPLREAWEKCRAVTQGLEGDPLALTKLGSDNDSHGSPCEQFATILQRVIDEMGDEAHELMQADASVGIVANEPLAESITGWRNSLVLAKWRIAEAPTSADAAAGAYEWGWRICSAWAKRDDLLADIGSPAYIKDRDDVLDSKIDAAIAAQPAEQARAERETTR